MNLLNSMPLYKTIKDQSNNIKQINTILTFCRNKKLLKYVKDNKHKADFEYPLSNDGLMYINNDYIYQEMRRNGTRTNVRKLYKIKKS